MDSPRFFVLDYEYADVANFIRSTFDLEDKLATMLYGGYGSVESTYVQLEGTVDDTTYQKATELYEQAEEIFKLSQDAGKYGYSVDASTLGATVKDLKDQLNTFTGEESSITDTRTEKDIFVESIERLCSRTSQALVDIDDFENRVEPKLKSFALGLINQLPADERIRLHFSDNALPVTEVDLKTLPEDFKRDVRKEELSLLNSIRLKKVPEKSNVIVGAFPHVSLAAGSMDRVVCAYSISTFLASDSSAEDFRNWWREMDRLLEPGGKAFIFPMQQRFPSDRAYNRNDLLGTLAEITPEMGGHMSYEFFTNPNPTSYRRDETLILTMDYK